MNGHHDLVSLFSQPKLELHHALIFANLYQIILKIHIVNSQLFKFGNLRETYKMNILMEIVISY